MDTIEQLARDLLARLSYDYGDGGDCPSEVEALFDRGEKLLPIEGEVGEDSKIKKLRTALAGLIGAESVDELRTMEAIIRMSAVPDADKVSMLNAIHVLLD